VRRFVVLVCAVALIATAMGSGDGRRISLSQHRVSVFVPSGWHMRYERINGVVDPVTIFTASTFALRVTATDQAGSSGVCSKALQRAWRTNGAYVQLAEERDGASRKRMLRRVMQRPSHFKLTARGGGGLCTPPNSGEIPFQEGGRAFYVFYGIGPKASRAMRAKGAELLDRLRIRPRS
jgi:hypothetical protein